MKKIKIGIMFALILLSGNTTVFGQGETPDFFLYRIDMNSVSIDGEFGVDEYPYTQDIRTSGNNKFAELGWGHNDTHLAVHIKSFGTGWVGLGLDNSVGVSVTMDTADILMGSVDGSSVQLLDMHADGQSQPSPDVDSYIDNNYVAGIEENGETNIEFIIPLQSNDIAGDDHNWTVSETYGFFLAYHVDDDSLATQHTAHSLSTLSVLVVDDEFHATEIYQEFEVNYDAENQVVELVTVVFEANSTIPVEGITINFYRKTAFGQLLLGSEVTNAIGMASLTTEVTYDGNVTFISSFKGSQLILAHQASEDVVIEEVVHIGHVDQPETFGDLRDVFGEEHLIRRFLLFGFYLTIFSVMYIYLTVIKDVLTLRSKGTEKKRSEVNEEDN